MLAVLLGRQQTNSAISVLPPALRAGSAVAEPSTDQALRRALESGDPAALADAGLPPETIRAFTAGRAVVKQQSRLRALMARADQTTPHWRRAFNGLNAGATSMTREMRDETRLIYQDYRNEIRAALGDQAMTNMLEPGAQVPFLSETMRKQLQRITEDYDQMMGEVYGESLGLQLPSDKEKLQLLKTEKERDIAALLGPELYQEFLSRTSNSSNIVRARYGAVIRDEAEYQAIFALQKAFDDRFQSSPAGPANADLQKARREAQPELDQAIADVLGSERVQEAQRNLNPEYQTLTALSSRLNLPADTAETVYASRDTYATQAQRISHDDSVPRPERTAQLRALAERAQTELQKTLGPDGAQAYAERAPWLQALSQGDAFSINPNGSVTIQKNAARNPPTRRN